jgi:CRP/FNR family transcriptional regulator
VDAERLLADLDLARLKGTFLGDLEADARRAFLKDATVLEVASGSDIFPEGSRVARLGVILDGSARAFLVAHDGRQLTIRYVRTGGMVSSVSGLGGPQVPIGTEAVTNCVVVEFQTERAFRLIRSDARVATGILVEAGRRLEETYGTLLAMAFAPTRERVAVQLLEVATELRGSGLVASLTQQQLADAVGSVREVVARVLRGFREERIVASGLDGIVILDPDRLVAIAARWRTPTRLFPVAPTLGSDAYLDANPDAVVAIDPAGAIIYANPSVQSVFGWLPRDLIGLPVYRLMPTDLAPRHAAHLARFFAKPTARPMGIGRGLRGRRVDGTEFPAEISLIPVQTPGGVAAFATIVDVSYRAEFREAVDKARSRPLAGDAGSAPG